jgi:hypothetical protein
MWQLVGTFLPIVGMGAVVASGVLLPKARWWILGFGPMGLLVVCWVLADPIAANGNMLFMVFLMGLFVGLGPYYAVLIVLALRELRKTSADRSSPPAQDG